MLIQQDLEKTGEFDKSDKETTQPAAESGDDGCAGQSDGVSACYTV